MPSDIQLPFDTNQQFAVLGVLDYVSDLITGSPKESYTRDEMLVILNLVRNDTELIEQEVVVAYEEATREIRG